MLPEIKRVRVVPTWDPTRQTGSKPEIGSDFHPHLTAANKYTFAVNDNTLISRPFV